MSHFAPKALISRESILPITRAGWRTVASASRDDFGMVASSIAFSSFLALLPLLALVMLAYGTIAEPKEVVSNLRALIRVIPPEARGIIDKWLTEALLEPQGRGAGFAVALGLLVFSASRSGRSLLYGLNVAYRVGRRRRFIARRATSMLVVLIAAALIFGALVVISVFAFIARFLPEMPVATQALKYLFWASIGFGAIAGLAAIYRFGPARDAPQWRAVVPGAILAAVLWLVMTGLFSLYINYVGSVGTVYGSLSAMILLQFWLFASAFLFLLGARFNVELADERGAKFSMP